MKLRNQLLAVCCLLVFAAFGFLYVRTWVVQKPFGIILFVSDGMIVRHLTAARLYQGGAGERLELERFPNVALLNNSARDFAVPDAASAATALATGTKVAHRSLAIGAEGQALRTILDVARKSGRAVGIVTTDSLSAATPGAFYAHTKDARDGLSVAQQFTETELHVALGGGAADFLPQAAGGARTDGVDLLAKLQNTGRDLVRTKAELEAASTYRSRPLVGVFSNRKMAFSDQIESGSGQPSLADMVQRAVECLQTNRKGYVLIVDAALVTTAAEVNVGERVITETLALDRAIGTAVRYAGAKSLIVAVGKHATGGMSLNGYPLRQDHGVALLGTNASGQPAITWATGPNGPAALPSAGPPSAADVRSPAPAPGARNEPAAFHTPSALNTAEDVLAVATGPGAEQVRGFLDNTAIFEILKRAL